MGPRGGYTRYPSPYFFRFSSRALSSNEALVHIRYHHTHAPESSPWSTSDSVALPSQDAPLVGMTSIQRQPTMTAKLNRKREQNSSNMLFESVSSCFSPLSPATPFPLRQRQAAKTYTSGQAQSWSLPLPRLANPGPRSLTRALAMSQDKALFQKIHQQPMWWCAGPAGGRKLRINAVEWGHRSPSRDGC